MSTWAPGDVVNGDTELALLFNCLGAGQFDISSFQAIAIKLKNMKALTVGDLQSHWVHGELIAALRALESLNMLTKKAGSYQAAISTATGIQFDQHGGSVREASGKGADWSLRCTKEAPSQGFAVHTFTPDGRVFQSVPALGTQDHLSKEEEALFVDAIFIDANLRGEKSIKDYLPAGMAKRIGKVWRIMTPPPLPFHRGQAGKEKARPEEKVALGRWLNARIAGKEGKPYPRMILSEQYRDCFGEKVAGSVLFVPEGDEQLIDNVRNDLAYKLYMVYQEKTAAVSAGQLVASLPLPSFPLSSPSYALVLRRSLWWWILWLSRSGEGWACPPKRQMPMGNLKRMRLAVVAEIR